MSPLLLAAAFMLFLLALFVAPQLLLYALFIAMPDWKWLTGYAVVTAAFFLWAWLATDIVLPAELGFFGAAIGAATRTGLFFIQAKFHRTCQLIGGAIALVAPWLMGPLVA